MRVAAIADLHCRVDSDGLIESLLRGVEADADVLVLPGDLTDSGLPEEMEVLLRQLSAIPLPVVAVLGNHDHESDWSLRLTEMMRGAGVHLLDGSVCEVDGVGFVGTKGFCGGFEKLTVQPFGERALKRFIRTSIKEAVRLENALARLESRRKVAVLHYAPVKDTLKGESPQLYPFLGSSRLGNALDRRAVDLILHGHAHHGSGAGRTPGGIPVHNVSRFVRDRSDPRAYRVFEL